MMKCEDGPFPIRVWFYCRMKLRLRIWKFWFQKNGIFEIVWFDYASKCSDYLATVVTVALIQTFPEADWSIPDKSFLFRHLNQLLLLLVLLPLLYVRTERRKTAWCSPRCSGIILNPFIFGSVHPCLYLRFQTFNNSNDDKASRLISKKGWWCDCI